MFAALVVADHQDELRRVGQAQFARDVHERVGDDLFAFECSGAPFAHGLAVSHCLRWAHPDFLCWIRCTISATAR